VRTTYEVTMSGALARVVKRLHALGPEVMMDALADTGDRAVAAWRGNINAGRSAAGRFKPLAPRYAEWKARHYPGTSILFRTGSMYRSFASRASRSGNVYVLELLSLGSTREGKRTVKNVDKARWALIGQEGRGRTKSGALKARKGSLPPANFGQAMGLQKRAKGEFALYRRPPRIFTALPPAWFLQALTRHLLAARR
jgi:hypothetical protein